VSWISDLEPDGRSAPPAELHFAAVGREHCDLLVRLFERNAVASVTGSFDPFPLTAAQARRIALERRTDPYYLALLGGCAVGMSMLRGFDAGYETPSFGIFVDHESHGQGIARQLTAWTIEQAQRLGCPAVRLSVYADNHVARGLYESLGFVEQERQRVERGGAQVTKLIMRLDLSA
jgi:ribosomal protein S18 acetylase RimI-like enzyme